MLSDLLAIFMSEAYAARLSRGVRCIYCGSLSVIVIGVCIGGIGVRPVKGRLTIRVVRISSILG
jgi:hypothetical protein